MDETYRPDGSLLNLQLLSLAELPIAIRFFREQPACQYVVVTSLTEGLNFSLVKTGYNVAPMDVRTATQPLPIGRFSPGTCDVALEGCPYVFTRGTLVVVKPDIIKYLDFDDLMKALAPDPECSWSALGNVQGVIDREAGHALKAVIMAWIAKEVVPSEEMTRALCALLGSKAAGVVSRKLKRQGGDHA